MSLENEWTVVVHFVKVDCRIGCSGIERRRFDLLQASPLGKTLRRDVGPVRAAILSHLNQAIVRARPDDLAVDWRDGHGEDTVKGFSAAEIEFYATTALLLGLVIASEVRADR